MHIGVAGNIGSGKTTLTRMLAEHYGWTPRFESVTYNPYLEDYYKNIPRWSYNLETYFLAQRFKDLIEISKSDKVIIQDRTLYEGVYIFVANNYAMGNLSKRDYETYMDLFNVMASLVHEPDLLIYLKCSMNDRYDKWISEYKGKVLTIDKDGLDFENRPEDFAVITDKIDAELYGLFPQE